MHIRRNALIVIVLMAAVIGVVPVTAAPLGSPPQLAYIDAQIDVMLPKMQAFQDQYLKLSGNYYQALESNSKAPDVPVKPDGLSTAPTDQKENLAFFWDEIAYLPSELAWSFHIDTYSGPKGEGYVLIASTMIDGMAWEKAMNYGPEEWRGYDWIQVEAE